MAKSKSYGGLIVLAVIILAAAGGSWYYFYAKGDKQPEFSTVKVGRGTITQSISATGTLQTTSQVTISSQVSGNVKETGADFNDHVTKGQMLLKIDPSTYQQRLRQAKADLEASRAQTVKVRSDTARAKELFEKKLTSQSEYDTAVAQLAQAESSLVSREAAAENAQTDLDRCVIFSPIDGIVLNRTIDVGATVNVNQSAVALFTIINDLTKLQISADVSEADIGNVQENQVVKFSVDAYLGRSFSGVVTQVRNFAKNSSGVVTFSVIIDVDNTNLMLKPGMTATANIIIAERPDVLVVANNALRVRIPPELLPKTPAPAAGAAAPAKSGADMTDEERMAATREVIASLNLERGTPPTPDQLEKAKKLATDKGLDPVLVTGMLTRMSGGGGGRGQGGGGGGGGRGGGGGGGGGRRGGSGIASGIGMNISNQPRTVYKLVTSATGKKSPEPVQVRLGISDGTMTQVLEGAAEGDTLITYVTMPGAPAPNTFGPPGGQNTNPFQQNQRGGFGGGGGGGRGF